MTANVNLSNKPPPSYFYRGKKTPGTESTPTTPKSPTTPRGSSLAGSVDKLWYTCFGALILSPSTSDITSDITMLSSLMTFFRGAIRRSLALSTGFIPPQLKPRGRKRGSINFREVKKGIISRRGRIDLTFSLEEAYDIIAIGTIICAITD